MEIREQRVLVCAPYGRDAQLVIETLRQDGVTGEPLCDLADLTSEVEAGAAAVIITEEALCHSIEVLFEAMKKQPAWSDLPVIVLTTGGRENSSGTWALIRSLEPIGNVSLLERPLRSTTLLSAVHVALRSRGRQYELRSLYEDLEKRVAERTAELRRLTAEAEGFSYAIAHDLRSPLRAIIGTSHILLEDFAGSLPEQAASQLQVQADEALRMATLINDLLRLSRLSREEMRLEKFDLSEMASEVAADLAKDPDNAKCTFEVQTGMEAHGDPLLSRLALMNLMQNACKFSPSGGLIRVGKTGDTFFVADQGIGFDQNYASKIFLPFERLVKNKNYPGTGIGLANVKRIVERHGGEVWVESQEGEGATFFFTLTRLRRTA